jgi:MFS transporter, YNFM family, putative membrane transport protein
MPVASSDETIPPAPARHLSLKLGGGSARNLLIGLTAFLTVVDLFATQAILPSLRAHYGVTPAAMSVAVNASTIGMAIAGLLAALFSDRVDRRRGIVASLAILAVPTLLLAHAPDLATFTVLRIIQGLCMASAFTLTLAYLGESAMSPEEATSAFAAYVTGNVASNLVGRLLSSGLADGFGLSINFYSFAALNLAGAVLAALTIRSVATSGKADTGNPVRVTDLLRDPILRRAFLIGFCILFAFIGVFTFINFVLVRPPLSIRPMTLGLVCLVFIPSIFTTPLAGRAVPRFGSRRTLIVALSVAGQPVSGNDPAGAGACRCRYVFRPSRRHRLRQPRRAHRPRSRQRALPRQLLQWRACWHGSARSAFRYLRLGCVHCRSRSRACVCVLAGTKPCRTFADLKARQCFKAELFLPHGR